LTSFRTKTSSRRATYLKLASQVENQLRAAYDRRYKEMKATQSSIAKILEVDRSVVNRRLIGHVNMRLDTIADMVWALDCKIEVHITDKAPAKPGQGSISPVYETTSTDASRKPISARRSADKASRLAAPPFNPSDRANS
jgi:hypothetical protein